MTQMAVAEAMGISQPTYQRWESGAFPIPESKQKKLAKLLKTSLDRLLGKQPDFDIFGIDEDISDTRKYYGEVSIHFETGVPLLLPISIGSFSRLYQSIQNSDEFIVTESLDNRIVFIRKAAIADIYFSSDAYDDYGPESYSGNLGIFPDDEFWTFVEYLENPECLDQELEREVILRLTKEHDFSGHHIDELLSSGEISSEEHHQALKVFQERIEALIDRSRKIIWQLSNGKVRNVEILENKEIYEALSLTEVDPSNLDPICLPVEGYHRTVFIQKTLIDYISAPKHKYYDGALDSTEEILGE